jgi:glutamyl-tRNA reductase
MKKMDDESYEKWVDKVRLYEYGIALQQITKGDNPEVVLDSMSKRIQNKLLHPIIDEIRKANVSTYDSVISKKHYEENYLNKTNRAADHVLDD